MTAHLGRAGAGVRRGRHDLVARVEELGHRNLGGAQRVRDRGLPRAGHLLDLRLPGGGTLSTIRGQLLRSNAKQFQGGLVFKARRLCITQLQAESNKEEEEENAHLPHSGSLRNTQAVWASQQLSTRNLIETWVDDPSSAEQFRHPMRQRRLKSPTDCLPRAPPEAYLM